MLSNLASKKVQNLMTRGKGRFSHIQYYNVRWQTNHNYSIRNKSKYTPSQHSQYYDRKEKSN